MSGEATEEVELEELAIGEALNDEDETIEDGADAASNDEETSDDELETTEEATDEELIADDELD